MNLNITARHFKLKSDLKDYIEGKMTKLPKFHENIINAEVIMGWEKMQRNVEIRLHVYNDKIIIEEKSEDLRKSFDLALNRVERQLVKYNNKIKEKRKDKNHVEESIKVNV